MCFAGRWKCTSLEEIRRGPKKGNLRPSDLCYTHQRQSKNPSSPDYKVGVRPTIPCPPTLNRDCQLGAVLDFTGDKVQDKSWPRLYRTLSFLDGLTPKMVKMSTFSQYRLDKKYLSQMSVRNVLIGPCTLVSCGLHVLTLSCLGTNRDHWSFALFCRGVCVNTHCAKREWLW